MGFNSSVQESKEQIPQPTIPPQIIQACTSEKDFKKVVFDLETTSGANNAEICELAAIHGTEQFNVYILPLHGITPTAAAAKRLSVSHGRMFYEGKPVTAVQLDVAIQKFLNWSQSLTEPFLFLAHNAKLFDAKHLLKALEMSSKTEQFSEVVVGFCDTLPAFKELFPERKIYSQENLARDLLESTYNAHNALNDVQLL
ncbi:maternal protein exuperantia-like [Montipora foliosa]|uniref:maternal protein exuperantia-like n=1 Tax=Montipora foliosa TaxID=591990 RepID=UPI0035F21495